MGNNPEFLKDGGKKMRRCGIYSRTLGCFILMSVFTSSLSFSIFERESLEVKDRENAAPLYPEGLEVRNVWEVLQELVQKANQAELEKEVSESKSKSKSESGPQLKMDHVMSQLLVDMMLTTVHGINDELSARNETKAAQEIQAPERDFHGKMKVAGGHIKEEILYQFNQTSNKIQTVHNELKEKIGTQTDQIKETGRNFFDGLKAKIMPQNNSSSSQDQETEMEFSQDKSDKISNQNDQNIVIENPFHLNHQIQIQLEPQVSMPNSSILTAPQFFLEEKLEGYFYAPLSDEWKTKCVNLPDLFAGEISSLKTGGHCLIICPKKDCKKTWGIKAISTSCKIISEGVDALGELENMGFNNKIHSFRRC